MPASSLQLAGEARSAGLRPVAGPLIGFLVSLDPPAWVVAELLAHVESVPVVASVGADVDGVEWFERAAA